MIRIAVEEFFFYGYFFQLSECKKRSFIYKLLILFLVEKTIFAGR